MENKRIIRIILTLTLALFSSLSFAASYNTAWSYTGDTAPQYWGKLDPTYQTCGVGKEQSPINIQQAVPTKNDDLKTFYQPAPINIIDDGLTQLNIHGQNTIVNDGHTIQLNFPQSGPNESIKINGENYQLVQFHFHTPSETQINGKTFPLEIHFVNQNQSGDVAVIAVFVKQGAYNPALAGILKNSPTTAKQLYTFNNTMVNVPALLPKNQAHYSFPGSLTTPPCTEGLQWIVMQQPIEASAQQLAQFEKVISSNARPVQPLNDRKVVLYAHP